MQTNQIELTDLFSVQELAARHPRVLSVLALRYQLRNRHANGLAKACVKIGKKLLISETRYQTWLSEQAGQEAA
ncbi:hypothetical protein [Ralstonia pseudosolanacearum]|uniref:hypothetical protein n=1 Tax=Ralstonia pseudosolanacearum TaxID=1310165 RepID=UPI0004919C05|nr:hypothetical protein [Ralstonia pseudosolanacearum]MDO3558275.1 hypothetical protein [Ralstonia pseudosolanacearum]MDO3575532.1 hypothetical protein [Ralstonia pseudosolanacearum]MDO3586904.1 hypothetical protein [Ralstonia pseudosolanacearum]